MARRAKSSFNPLYLLIGLAVIGIIAFLGYKSLSQNSSSGASYAGTTDLSLSEYLENSNALSNNTYRIEGIVDERLDNWLSNRGRLFSVIIEDGNVSSPLPVLVPEKFNTSNIQRGQRYRFKVTVQAGSGVLEVTELTKA